MEISLPADLEQFVLREVERGAYSTPSELVEAAVHRFKTEDDLGPCNVRTEQELEEKVLEGVKALESGLVRPAEEVFADLRARTARHREQNA